ncbi:FMN-binding protein [Peptoniphilus equinus]|uniref:Ion-translocating oxidoreductase complex subunit G n=1 Tax=Peptoniphilus equinus TaxID=3016343 RepID=A0ABY7QTF2_9FIRM|nr:FMN-binding protein [Peptoniphilus equinus]WBW50076.1 FMN-binding protein [Peptoniphilus equinus]
MKKEKQSIAYPVIFLSVLTLVYIFVLAGLDFMTKDVVAQNQALELEKKILYVFNLQDDYTTDDEARALFSERVTTVSETVDGEAKTYALLDGDKEIAYAVPFAGPGLWGSITGYLGVNSDFTTLTGIEFITQSETPGLGGRIAEEAYKAQYRGLDISAASDKLFVINRPAPGGNIDAITGATQTSKFVVNMVNDDLDTFLKEVRHGE